MKSRHLTLPIIIGIIGFVGCARQNVALPTDILGISVGMSKADAQKRLEEIGTFETDARKRQQLWRLKDASRFSQIAVGYDAEDKVRFVSAFIEPKTAAQPVRFSDVGDLSLAKAEITAPHHRYIWQVEPRDGRSGYIVNIYGDNPEFVTTYALAKTIESSAPVGQ